MNYRILSPLKKYVSKNLPLSERSFWNIEELLLKKSKEIILDSEYSHDHIESWKYTSLDHLIDIEFNNYSVNKDLNKNKLEKKIKDEIQSESINLFFINGYFSQSLSSKILIERDSFFFKRSTNPN